MVKRSARPGRGAFARRARRSADADAPEAVRTLAVLLQAGATPPTAWRHLADSGVAEAAAVVAGIERGQDLIDAIRTQGGVWATVATAWRIGATVGAPLGEVLRAIAAALDAAAEIRDEVEVALAEPTGTARLMLWLPVVGLLLGTALGFDTARVLVTQPAGWVCLVAGTAMLLLARAWTRALVRRARPAPVIPGIRADLLVVALTGGTAIPRACRLVVEEVGEDAAGSGDGAIERVLRLSASAGVPAVELLRAEADRARRQARTEGRKGAAVLSSRLLLPLAVCTLPAFLLLGVAPLILSVMATTPLPLR